MATNIDGLTVINFPAYESPPAAAEELRKHAFHLQTCKRELFILDSSKEIPNLPPEAKKLTGKEAYAFALRVLTGLENPANPGEEFILGDAREQWNILEGADMKPYLKRRDRGVGTMMHPLVQDPEVARPLKKYMDPLFQDAALIRAQILGPGGQPSFEDTMRRMLDLRGGENILVVCDDNKRIEFVVKALGADHLRKSAGSITLTSGQGVSILPTDALDKASSTVGISAGLSALSFKEATKDGFAAFDHVVVLSPPGKNMMLDQMLRVKWGQRQKDQDGRMVLLWPGKTYDGKLEALPNVITHEQVNSRFMQDKKHGDERIDAAGEACELCAQLRQEGAKQLERVNAVKSLANSRCR